MIIVLIYRINNYYINLDYKVIYGFFLDILFKVIFGFFIVDDFFEFLFCKMILSDFWFLLLVNKNIMI